VVKLAQVDILRLRIPVPESLAASVRPGTSADITVQATGEHLTGKVARLTDSLDRSTRTMQVEVDVPNKQYRLSPGMYAKVVLQVRNAPNALTLPVQAVERSGDKTSVLFVNQQNRVQVRDVLTGIEDGDRVEILSGLSKGDRVVIGQVAAFHDGQLVEPKPSTVAEKPFQAGSEP
jgi:RND family efflux transporter MFP subunit